MAEKKYLDSNGLLYVWSKIKALLGNKVDKVEGKGLSTNDLTDELKQKILDAGSSSFDGQYTSLIGKPSINGVELKSGANTLAELGIASTTELTSGLAGKVDKVEGKQLSTEDYTTAEKTKLAGIAEGAEANVIEGVKVNGVEATITDKIAEVTINVPTKVSELTNDSKFQTESEVASTVATAVNGLATENFVKEQIANINKKEVVTSVDAMTDPNTIYLMANAGETNNIYDEYIVIVTGEGEAATKTVEKIGTTEVDLTNYVQESDLVAITNAEIDAIFNN